MQKRWFYIATLMATLTVWFTTNKTIPVFPVDDAYITLHNAQVIWWGHDPNYAGSTALCGATSAVHLGLVTMLMTVMKPLWALHTAAWLSIIAYVLGLSRLAFLYRASTPVAALFVIAGVTVALTPHQLMNGLETGLALAALTWMLVYSSDRAKPANRVLPILCGTIPFIRPELVALSAIIMSLRCLRHLKSSPTRRTALTACAIDMALAAAATAPWFVWYWVSTGMPFPSTIAAKRAFFAETHLPISIKTQWVTFQLEAFALKIGILSAAAVGLILSRTGRAAVLFCVILLGCYWAQFPGALAHYEQRYLYIILPFVLYGAMLLFASRSLPLRVVAAMLLVLGTCQSLYYLPYRWKEYNKGVAFTQEELAGVASGCNATLPKNSVLLIHDAGYIAYATKFRMVDMVGLKTPSSVDSHLRLTLPSSGTRRWDALNEIALRSKADHLVVLANWERIFGIAHGLQQKGWRLRLLNNKSAAYHVYKLTRPPVTHTTKQSSTRLRMEQAKISD